jgi:hypothetical protein
LVAPAADVTFELGDQLGEPDVVDLGEVARLEPPFAPLNR